MEKQGLAGCGAALFILMLFSACNQATGGGPSLPSGILETGEIDGKSYTLKAENYQVNGDSYSTLTFTAESQGEGHMLRFAMVNNGEYYGLFGILFRDSPSYSKSDYDSFLVQTSDNNLSVVIPDYLSSSTGTLAPGQYGFAIGGDLSRQAAEQLANASSLTASISKSADSKLVAFKVPLSFARHIKAYL